jgi:uncharacterized protein with PIN domain
MHANAAQFRFYEELNDFLPPATRKQPFEYHFNGRPSIKDAIEAIGVPHPEVDLIVVNGRSVDFDYHLSPGDRVAVYPVFESIDIEPVTRLRARPLRRPAFVLDGHLGKLARLLRMLGFDALWRVDYSDRVLVDVAREGKRTILTHNRELLKRKTVTHGYWVRSTDPDQQIEEVVARLDLAEAISPFSRCMLCNAPIKPANKKDVLDQVPARTAAAIDEYCRCTDCGKVYWKGSHYDKMSERVQKLCASRGR